MKEIFEQDQIDWFSEMTKEEQKEIGLTQANADNYVANETVMKRFDKWRIFRITL